MFRGVVAVVTILTLAVPPVLADSRAQTEAHFKSAEALYQAGQFREALEGYLLAYKAQPMAAFVFNMAQCYMALEEYREAAQHYSRFLQEAPPSHPARTMARDRLKQARSLLQRKSSEITASEASRAPPVLPGTHSEPAAPPPGVERPMYMSWWFWTVVGGVALVAGTTAWLMGGDRKTVQPAGSLGTIDTR